MAAILIAAYLQYPFGSQTNTVISRLIATHTQMARLKEAIATASAGFTGTAGTQFEVGNPEPADQVPNLFGVQAGATPGAQGEAYRYAMESLASAWEAFWDTAGDFIQALDNGAQTM